MFCQSCGAQLPDDASSCLKCGASLQTGNIAAEGEITLLKSRVRVPCGEGWENATLIITKKNVKVQRGTSTAYTPFSYIKAVDTRKDDIFSPYDLRVFMIPGFEGEDLHFRVDTYEETIRVAALIDSLITHSGFQVHEDYSAECFSIPVQESSCLTVFYAILGLLVLAGIGYGIYKFIVSK